MWSKAVFLEMMPSGRRARRLLDQGSPGSEGLGAEVGHLASPPKAIVKSQAHLGKRPGHWDWHGDSLMGSLQGALLHYTP